EGEWTVVAPRVHEQEYDVDHHGEHFWIRVNDTGRNFRIVKAPVASPGREHWQEVVAHRADVMLEGLDLFRGHAVVFERGHELPEIRVTDLATGDAHRLAFPEATYSAYPEANLEFDTTRFRYGYESLVTPRSVYEYDLTRRATALLKRNEVRGGYDETL